MNRRSNEFDFQAIISGCVLGNGNSESYPILLLVCKLFCWWIRSSQALTADHPDVLLHAREGRFLDKS